MGGSNRMGDVGFLWLLSVAAGYGLRCGFIRFYSGLCVRVRLRVPLRNLTKLAAGENRRELRAGCHPTQARTSHSRKFGLLGRSEYLWGFPGAQCLHKPQLSSQFRLRTHSSPQLGHHNTQHAMSLSIPLNPALISLSQFSVPPRHGLNLVDDAADRELGLGGVGGV